MALLAATALAAQDDPNQVFKGRVYVPVAGSPGRTALELPGRIMLVQDGKAPVAATPGYRFKAGEKFKLEVRPPLAGFIYILQDDPDSSQRPLLYPIGKNEKNQVEAGQILQLPRDWSFRFTAGPPFRLYVVVSAAPLPELTRVPLDVRQAVSQIMARVSGDGSIALREIAVTLR